jgi:hypothetical protein
MCDYIVIDASKFYLEKNITIQHVHMLWSDGYDFRVLGLLNIVTFVSTRSYDDFYAC